MNDNVVEIWPQRVWRELREHGDPELAAMRAGKTMGFLNAEYKRDEKFRLTCNECLNEWAEEKR
jgi:hypothetical protein